MGKIFRHDSPIMNFFSSVGDHMLVNVLFVLFSLPVITIGSSITASFKVLQMLAEDKSCRIVREFTKAFKENFKQSTIVWCISLVVFAVFIFDFIVAANSEVLLMRIWFTGALILSLMLVAVLCYVFPLISRYENGVLNHMKNGAILAAANLPRTLVLMVLALLPAVVFFFLPAVFFYLLPFWLLLFFSMLTRAAVGLMLPVFRRIEENGNKS